MRTVYSSSLANLKHCNREGELNNEEYNIGGLNNECSEGEREMV